MAIVALLVHEFLRGQLHIVTFSRLSLSQIAHFTKRNHRDTPLLPRDPPPVDLAFIDQQDLRNYMARLSPPDFVAWNADPAFQDCPPSTSASAKTKARKLFYMAPVDKSKFRYRRLVMTKDCCANCRYPTAGRPPSWSAGCR